MRRIILIAVLSVLSHGEAKESVTLQETIQSCKPGTPSAKKCFIERILKSEKCHVTENTFNCDKSPEVLAKVFSDRNLSTNCTARLNANPTATNLWFVPVDASSQSPCKVNGFEVLPGRAFIMDHATKDKDGKWYVPPPVIPIGLRSVIKPDEIIVTSISNRYRFCRNAPDYDDSRPDDLFLGFPYEYYTQTPTGQTELIQTQTGSEAHRVFKTDPNKVKLVNRVADAYGLEKSGNFLSADRHIVGKSKDLNYSFVSGFKPKVNLKICGHVVPKGTELTLSLEGVAYSSVLNVLSEGTLYIHGIPNTKMLNTEGNPKLNALVCIPRAAIATNFSDFLNKIVENPDAKLPPIPKPDYNDCECIPKEVKPEA